MRAVKGDKYGNFTEAQKATFKVRCINEGIEPTEQCPVCLGRRLTREQMFRYDHDQLDFVHYSIQVDCHRCRVRYIVVQNSGRATKEENTDA